MKPFVFLPVVLATLWMAGSAAGGESWAERARRMNRKEISADEAKSAAAGQEVDRRNKIAMRRIAPAMKGVDWDTDPTAVPYLLYQVNKRTDLPIYVNNEGLDLATRELFEYTVVYLTSHTFWSLNDAESKNLALWLKRGGTLYLDDCYDKGSPFTDAVRPEVTRMIPGAEPRFMTRDDPRTGDAFRMIYAHQLRGQNVEALPWPGDTDFGGVWQYYLLDDRPAVCFSPNDDGCHWEISTPPTASNPLGEGIGHGGGNAVRELIYQICVNWMLFAYTH